jgi:hypothetical protein
MFINNFNKIIISELKYVLSEIPEDQRTVETLIDKFSEYIGGDASKKVKKPTKAKEPVLANVRCLALKKDLSQCNGKRNKKDNSEAVICALHQRIGAKYGQVEDSSESSESEDSPVSVPLEEFTPEPVAVKKPTVKKDVKKAPKVKTPEKVSENLQDELEDMSKLVFEEDQDDSEELCQDDNEEDDFE